MEVFSKNLSSLMKEQGISQSKLAAFLNVSQQTISKYMNNKIDPCLEAVAKIALFFDVTTDYLLGLED